MGWHYYHGESRNYIPEYELSSKTSNDKDDVYQSQNYSIYWTWENTANWVKSFGNHNIDVLVGSSLERHGYGNSINVTNSDSNFDNFERAYIVNADVVDLSTTSIGGRPVEPDALASFITRLNYNWNETYLLSLVMRAGSGRGYLEPRSRRGRDGFPLQGQ